MNFQKNAAKKISLVLFLILSFGITALAQDKKGPTIDYGAAEEAMPVAARNNLYCAGYIQKSSINTSLEIVGADDEKDQYVYAEGDELYISGGSGAGVQVGDMYSVIRPRGNFKSKFSNKGNLGIFVQELGAVEVIRVMGDVSVARVKTSCSEFLLGDLLVKSETRVSPKSMERPALDRFASSSGKASGSIVLARGGLEILGREQIVYVDLGREDNVQIGDYLTVYRPLGTGNIFTYVQPEHIDNKDEGFESDRYKGGGYSNRSARKKGSNADGAVVTTEDAKSRRPKGLRKIVGELVVLNVFERTATAVIVRNASEIHTGDRVEIQ